MIKIDNLRRTENMGMLIDLVPYKPVRVFNKNNIGNGKTLDIVAIEKSGYEINPNDLSISKETQVNINCERPRKLAEGN